MSNRNLVFGNGIICRALVVVLALSLFSCSSSGPATSYYSLFSSDASANGRTSKADNRSLGVAKVSLPGYLDSSAIVTRTTGQKLNISGSHAWAEALDEAITRTLAAELRNNLGYKEVAAFPWDMRLRPALQLQVKLEKFDGIRGVSSGINASWSLYSVEQKKVLEAGSYSDQIKLSSSSYEAYVASLNALLLSLSKDIAVAIK